MGQLFSKLRLRHKKGQQEESQNVSSPQISAQSENFRWLEGRGYSQKGNAAYVLPNDDYEFNRLNSQHYQWRYLFQRNYNAPMLEELQRGIKVLDVNCGTGIWSVEMASQFPASTFVGTDITDVFASTTNVPPNCSFLLANTCKGLPFEDGEFDYVFQRASTLCFTTIVWPDVIKELTRLVKPGGMVEIFDTTLVINNGGPSLTLLANEWLGTALSLRDIDTTIVSRLGPLLEEAGIQNVKQEEAQWTLAWDNTNNEKYAEMSKENVFSALKASQPQVVVALGIGEDEYEEHMKKVEEEMKTFKPYFELFFYYGRKVAAPLL